MTIALQGTSAAISSASASSGTITWPGSPSGQMLLAVFGFEGVAAGSGPWITGTPQGGWARTCYQAPSGSGNGIEIWNTNGWSSGPTTQFNFAAAMAYVAFGQTYTGQYGQTNVIRASLTAQVTGNNPAAPGGFAFLNEMIIACSSTQLNSSGYTAAPTGMSGLATADRGGTHGNVEIATANEVVGVSASYGSFPFIATAASGGTLGATATLFVRAAPGGGSGGAASTSPMIVAEYR